MLKSLKQGWAFFLPAILLVGVSLGWWTFGGTAAPAARRAPPERGPLLAGVRFSSWQGAERTCALQIRELELVPKRWGPFKLVDSQDVRVVDCRLQADQAALAASLQEIGRTLGNLVKGQGAAGIAAAAGSGGGLQPLLVLPPQIAAAPFSCRIVFPQGKWLSLQAGEAVFAPGQLELQLAGGVKVTAANGARLAADQANWQVTAQKMFIEGQYSFREGRRRFKGNDGQFSLARGRVGKLRPEPKAPLAKPGGLPQNMLVEMFTKAFSEKRLPGGEALFLPLLAAQAGTAPPLDFSGLRPQPEGLIPDPALDPAQPLGVAAHPPAP